MTFRADPDRGDDLRVQFASKGLTPKLLKFFFAYRTGGSHEL